LGKTKSNLGKIFCIPENMHSRTPVLQNSNKQKHQQKTTLPLMTRKRKIAMTSFLFNWPMRTK